MGMEWISRPGRFLHNIQQRSCISKMANVIA
jgi:hypothetical protein